MTLDLDDAWIRDAKVIDDFACDAVFVTVRLDVGDRDALSAALVPSAQELFRTVGVTMPVSGYLPSAAVVGHEESLIRYYQASVAAATRLGELRRFSHPFPFFGIQPSIRCGDVELTQFSWINSILETVEILTVLKDASNAHEGLLWDDVDQGWAAQIVRRPTAIVLVEWNWEDDADIPDAFSFDAVRLTEQAGRALDRLASLHRGLVGAFGRDYWTYVPPASPPPPPNAGRRVIEALRRWGWGR